jgi:hypothetical protein
LIRAIRTTEGDAADGLIKPTVRVDRNDRSSMLHAMKAMRDNLASIVAQVTHRF